MARTYLMVGLLGFLAGPALGFAVAATDDGHDFIDDVTGLYQLAACGGDDGGAGTVAAKTHCVRVRGLVDRYQKGWLRRAAPFLRTLRPASLPSDVVYPFGGGDVVGALATFPDAAVLTTMSLEPVRDPRRWRGASPDVLAASLIRAGDNIQHLLHAAHNKTSNMSRGVKDPLPGELVLGLVGLLAHGYEPVAARFFQIAPDGQLRYLRDLETEGKDRKWFDNVQIDFAPLGGGTRRIWRHVAANLDDVHFQDSPLKRHLEAKGDVAAMTKAASYLLWGAPFTGVRTYLSTHAVWMISDSTGLAPKHAQEAHLSQQTYGAFTGTFLPNRSLAIVADLVALWKAQPVRALPMRYGYPDVAGNGHLMVTTRDK